MKIAVLAFDTRGGVQPYVALSRGLADAGHDVTLVSTSGFADLAAEHGVRFAATTGSAERTVRTASGVAEMGARQRNRFMREQMMATIERDTAEVLAAADGADLLLGGVGGSITGRPVAERLGVPYVEAHLQPLGPPTSAFPGPLLPSVPGWLGGFGRRASHRVTDVAVSTMFGAASRRARTVLGLTGRPRPVPPGLPAVYGFSPRVVPHPPEWGPERRFTGYWTLPAGPGWAPPPDLADFVSAGPAPVCIGFGSMASEDPEALTTMVLEAVRRAGVRAVLLSGWGGLADRGGDDVFAAVEVPHGWLYPQVAAVVHHGGAGTTGAALTAGVPAVVVPFAVDQPFWGSRVTALGVGPTPIPRKQLTADALGDALRRTVADDGMRRRAAELGAQIRTEDGVGEAVRHLTSWGPRLARAT